MIRESEPQTLAAVDLGSNSFHMVVARILAGQPSMIDKLREQVQLASGLDSEMMLGKRARKRALACLERFGQRIRDLDQACVRAVATNTLRVARNARTFLADAEAALGHPIEIVSGREEARLIYLGVSHGLPGIDEDRLVVDIGGGSTECILGHGFDTVTARSIPIGCVSYTRRFFDDGRLRASRFEKAITAARLKLRDYEENFAGAQWQSAFGSSGTIRSVGRVLELCRGDTSITPKGLDWLTEQLVDAGHVDRIDLDGLKPERAPVIAGGIAVLRAILDSFGVQELGVAGGAMREGVIYDLLGRLQHEDVRDRTIHLFQERFHVDKAQAQRVEESAVEFLRAVEGPWKLEGSEPVRFLGWAARLHEIGLAVSFDQYTRHGAYLIENTDMPGFSRDDQTLLALLIRSHRGKLRRSHFKRMPARTRRTAIRLTTLLRIAVRLHRHRSSEPRPEIKFRPFAHRLVMEFPKGWLGDHPMTRVDIEKEAVRLAPLGFQLEVRDRSSSGKKSASRRAK